MKIATYVVLGLALAAITAAFGCWAAFVWGQDYRWAETGGIMVTLAVAAVFGFVFMKIWQS